MTFLWPGVLLLLAVLPLLVLLRVWALRRRQTGVRFSSLSLVRAAAPGSSRLRRHLPFALFVLGLGSLVFAIARPAAIVAVPTDRTTVVLAMDVSRSMCATDIPPNRLVAAEEAAASFVEGQGSGTQIGIVAFAGFAEIVQIPTNDEEVLLDVIAALATGRRTAIGSAILESIDAIAEIDPSIAESVDPFDPDASAPPSVPEGAYAPAIIVLLTDGASNAGPEPLVAAEQAAARGLRVYTIGFGTENPGGDRPPQCGAQYIGSEPGDNGNGGFDPQFGGGRVRRDRRRLPAGDRRGDPHRGGRGDGRGVLPGRERRAAQRRLRAAPHGLHPEARGRRGERRLRGSGGAADLARDPAWPGLAAVAVGGAPTARSARPKVRTR